MSCYDTCFFERYAHETLRRCLGHEYDGLVNRDRPDLQSEDGHSWGIEVTRAMEESKSAAQELLGNMTGLTEMEADSGDVEQFLLSGYGYGLNIGRNVSAREQLYWSMAMPMKRILESKVSKLISGLYGDFGRNGLYVFSKDDLTDVDVINAYKHVLELQRFRERHYDFLYLSEISSLHVCNLSENISDTYRVSEFQIPIEMRRSIFLSALPPELHQ